MYKPIIRISHQKPVILEDDFDLFGSSGIFEDSAKKCAENFDNMVRKAFGEIKIDVDEAELLKVLAYDRDQYEKGYEDGKTEALTWTSVKERLPKYGERILACGHRGGIFCCKYLSYSEQKGGFGKMDQASTHRHFAHWLPLPEPPKTDGWKD